MPATYDEFVELARMCWRQAQLAQTHGAAQELLRMARDYQEKAANLDSGRRPEIAKPAAHCKPMV